MLDNRYAEFLARKAPRAISSGFTPSAMPDHLFDFQKHCVEFAVRQGRAGLYLDTGLGKTRCQLEWAWQCVLNMPGRAQALILTPLAVARQMEREARELGYDVRVIREQSEAKPGINICNYDRLDKLDVNEFGAVSLDESSILKSFGGKTAESIIALFSGHRFRLSATATPAPNDHMELGQQASFLGVMPANEMLMRWFINDTKKASQHWRLKGHAADDFWDWMASWSRMAQSPDDMGFDGSLYVMPDLIIKKYQTESSFQPKDGSLFAMDVSATSMHETKRRTAHARADVIAAVSGGQHPFIAWCDTDYEADALHDRMPDAVEVRGSMRIEQKEESLEAFSLGQVRRIITKPSVAGFGLNWQHCHNMGFAGRSFSYEAWYQAVRRSLRFGQKFPVTVHIAVAEGEDQIGRVIDRKAGDHISMKASMVKAMRRAVNRDAALKISYQPTHRGDIPSWLTSAA
jgi:hypothetical protein